MKTFKQYLLESHGYSKAQEFIIRPWGKLLYLDYFHLEKGPDMSRSTEFKSLVNEYISSLDDRDAIDELDEWIQEGAKLKNGNRLITKATVDSVLHSCAVPASKELILYRFDHTPTSFKSSAWISFTTRETGYPGTRRTYKVDPDDLVVFTHGLADKGEVIVWSDEIRDRQVK